MQTTGEMSLLICLIIEQIILKFSYGNCLICLVFCIKRSGNKSVSSKLSWETRLRIALEAAKGLEYLHEHISPPVIHRDFKSSNILLDKNFHAKVSDFGLAKLGPEKAGGHVSTRVLGTQGYVAPEYNQKLPSMILSSI